jgi:16S rRNA (cytidine1402-2'-O)-methyltransferase
MLSVVATPIGNLEDMTFRAVRVLKEADYILCEDTRVTGKLLKRYDIATPLKRYDAHASESAHARILSDLASGTHVALVSDAGTPGISDPGVLLVRRLCEETRLGTSDIRVEAIPGPSALTAAFSVAGIPGNRFTFLGYAPQKKGRDTFFKEVEAAELPVIFFESTHRIMKTLDALRTGGTHLVVARELTKLHEELIRGSAAEVSAYLTEHPDHQKGEFVVMASREA